jgi:hypothetical protein
MISVEQVGETHSPYYERRKLNLDVQVLYSALVTVLTMRAYGHVSGRYAYNRVSTAVFVADFSRNKQHFLKYENRLLWSSGQNS